MAVSHGNSSMLPKVVGFSNHAMKTAKPEDDLRSRCLFEAPCLCTSRNIRPDVGIGPTPRRKSQISRMFSEQDNGLRGLASCAGRWLDEQVDWATVGRSNLLHDILLTAWVHGK